MLTRNLDEWTDRGDGQARIRSHRRPSVKPSCTEGSRQPHGAPAETGIFPATHPQRAPPPALEQPLHGATPAFWLGLLPGHGEHRLENLSYNITPYLCVSPCITVSICISARLHGSVSISVYLRMSSCIEVYQGCITLTASVYLCVSAVCVSVCVYLRVSVCVSVYLCVYLCTCVYLRVSLCICVYWCLSMCSCVCIVFPGTGVSDRTF